VAFGAGVSLFTFSQTDTDVYLADLLDQSKAFINLRGDQQNTNSLTYGLLFWPMDKLRLGAVYRDSESFVIRGLSKVEVEDLHQFSDQLLDFRVQFRPSQAGLGAAYQLSSVLGLSGDLVWYRWSRYRDTHNERPSPSFNDTYSPRVGVEYVWRPMWVLRGGYVFEPTPVPPQTGRTNYVDNHKNVLSGGVGFRLPSEGYVASFDLFGQAHLLVPRETAKEATRQELLTTSVQSDFNVEDSRDNPGWPGFESGGTVYAFGLTFSVGR
jgi:long-subunit fatty acid transport protein